MAEIINQIADWIQAVILTFGYPGIFGVMLVENIFPPVPTDPLLPFAGLMAARGQFNFWLVWGSAVLGAVTGSLVLYLIGTWLDETVVRRLLRRWGGYVGISERELDRVLALFNRYGAPAVFMGRMIPVMRSAVSLTAGMSRMPLGKFTFFTALSSALVTGFWTLVGYVLGENWTLLLDLIDQFEPFLIVLLVIGIGVGFVIAWRMVGQMGRPLAGE